MMCASCIKDQSNNIIGTVLLALAPERETFLSLIRGYNVECTIFSKDLRIFSTLKNAIGTKLDNPLVVQEVLEKGNIFCGQVQVFGEDYRPYY